MTAHNVKKFKVKSLITLEFHVGTDCNLCCGQKSGQESGNKYNRDNAHGVTQWLTLLEYFSNVILLL